MPLYEQKQNIHTSIWRRECTHFSTSYSYTFDNIHYNSLLEWKTYTNPSGRTKDTGFSGLFIVNHRRFYPTIQLVDYQSSVFLTFQDILLLTTCAIGIIVTLGNIYQWILPTCVPTCGPTSEPTYYPAVGQHVY